MEQLRIKVSIDWVLPENGGRNVLIRSLHYRPTIQIESDIPERSWSFFLEFYSYPQYEIPTIAEGGFLSDTCPWKSMLRGTKFLVLEGLNIIGKGIVLETARMIDISDLPTYQDYA